MEGKISKLKRRFFGDRKVRKIDSVMGPKDDIDSQDNYEERKLGISFMGHIKTNWIDIN